MIDIPILVTWDVDPITPDEYIIKGLEATKTPEEHLKNGLEYSLELIEELDIKTTYLFPATVALSLKKNILTLINKKQEIGCHGYNHNPRVDFVNLNERTQRLLLEKASHCLASITGGQIKTFRAPRSKISHTTLRILDSLGYLADLSVCSQRFDCISSNLINVNWLYAPRLPYHPSEDNAFRKGDMRIWEIPTSALIFPFISGTMKIFGLKLMKRLLRILYHESLKTGKPIVYMMHPQEFSGHKNRSRTTSINCMVHSKNWRIHGIPIRYYFFNNDGEKLFRETKELYEYIASLPRIKFMTVEEYVFNLESDNKKDFIFYNEKTEDNDCHG